MLTMSLLPSVMAANTNAVSRGRPSWAGNKSPTVKITSPSDGDTVSGIVMITVDASDKEDGTLTPSIYIDGNLVANSDMYEWDTTTVDDGSHTIYAEAKDSAGATGSDTISVTVSNNGGSPPPSDGDGVVNRYAVIVGISDYKAINDLSYCDEDATDWYNYLHALGYQIVLLGDGTNDYPQWNGLATEANVKAALQNMISNADADDIIVFASSGHGTEIKNGHGRTATYNQALCMWDTSAGEDGEDGLLYDTELASIFAASKSKTFIFLDHCYSGGMNEVMDNSNSALIYMTTTCTDDGYGYDDSTHQNGAWTYWFLEAGLENHFGSDPNTTMEEAYDWALSQYPYGGGDTPQEFDGNPAEPFTL